MKVAEVAVVPVRNGVNGPPLSETKMSKLAMPEPPGSSLPDQLRVKPGAEAAGSAVTVLVGGPASIVLLIGAVLRGVLVEDDGGLAGTTVPVASVALGWTV